MCVVEELRAVDVRSSHQFEEEIGAASSENGLFIAKIGFSVWTGRTTDDQALRKRRWPTSVDRRPLAPSSESAPRPHPAGGRSRPTRPYLWRRSLYQAAPLPLRYVANEPRPWRNEGHRSAPVVRSHDRLAPSH